MYLPLALALSALVYGLLQADANIHLQKLQVQEASEVKVAAQLLGHNFEDVISDLQFLSQAPSLKRFINDHSQSEKQLLTDYFRNLALAKGRYDQIRYLDNRGMEIIRINLVANKAVIVPASALQNKAQRYFFKETLKLGEGGIYISPLDLNIEQGQVELPYKPMLRFGTPVFDSAGKKQGILLFNYYGQKLLDNFNLAMGEGHHAMLLNRDGYWLHNPDPSREWGFMFGRDDTFGKSHPDEWASISSQQQGSMLSHDGLYTFSTVFPLLTRQQAASENASSPAIQEYYWKIVSLVPAAEVPAVSVGLYPRSFALLGSGLLLLGALSVYLASTLFNRRQLRRSVFENAARLQEITSTVAEGIYVIDEHGLMTFVNPEAERLLGWSRNELMGQHAHQQFHYRDLDGSTIQAKNCEIYQAIRSGKTYRSTTQVFWHKDGSSFHVDVNASPILHNGKIAGAVVAFRDISKQKQAEEELLRAEAMFQMVFNNVADAIVIHDIAGRFVEVNQVFLERLGYSHEELLRLSPADINDTEGAGKFQERAAALKAQGQITFETAHISKNGRKIPVEVNSRLIEYSGKPATLSVVRDISERKAAQEALRSSAATARALLNATTESAILMDVHGTVLAINKVAAKRLRKKPDEIINHNLYDFIPSEVEARRKILVDEIIHSGRPAQFQDERNGLYLDQSLYPIFDAQGKVSHVAIYAADITERKKLEAEETLLHHIDVQVMRSNTLTGLLQFICDEVVHLFDYHFAWLAKKEGGGAFFIAAQSRGAGEYLQELLRIGVRWDDTPQGRGPAGACIRSGHMQIFKISDANFQPWRADALRFGFQAIAGIPLIVRGEVYGALMLYSRNENDFNESATLQRLSGIASRICVALEMAMDQEQLRLLSSALASAGNSIFITDPTGRIQWVNNAFTRLTGYTAKEAIGQSPALLKSGKQDAAYYQKLWKTIQQGQTWSSETVERHKTGMLYTVQQTITPIQDENGKITHYISILDDISSQKEISARIQYMAHFDALTALPNRALFYDRLRQVLAQAKRNGLSSALMYLDLDRFKAVNDTLGHHIGDLLLQEVAKRITDCVRKTDTVSRLAGDEFTVLLPQVNGSQDAALIAEKITAALAQPFHLDGHEVNIGSSTGIAFYPADADSDEALIKCADSAMYAAKKQGRGTFSFFRTPEN